MKKLEGKVAVVTGAKGIGASIAFDPELQGITAIGGITYRSLFNLEGDNQTFFDHNIDLSAK